MEPPQPRRRRRPPRPDKAEPDRRPEHPDALEDAGDIATPEPDRDDEQRGL